jgi:hypothetical protein
VPDGNGFLNGEETGLKNRRGGYKDEKRILIISLYPVSISTA